MNIKSRIVKLERYCSKGHEVIVPTVEFVGGSNQEDCTRAIASWGEENTYEVQRAVGERFSEFERRFVTEYIAKVDHDFADVNTRTVVLENDADLL